MPLSSRLFAIRTLPALTAAWVCVVSLAAVGCQDPRGASKQETKPGASGPDKPEAYSDAEMRDKLYDMFKDQVEFTAAELSGGKTNCDDVLRQQNLENDIVPWPDELKKFLVDELEALPITQQVIASVFAIYLVEDRVLLTESGSSAAGLACDRGTDYKGVIFVSVGTFVKERASRGVGTWQELRSIQEKHILLDSGDNAALTLVHEILHAIDNKLYVNGVDAEARAKRDAVFALSWVEHTQPRFERIDLMSLTAANEGKRPMSGCRTRGKDVADTGGSLALTANASGATLADELRYLADKTNFIVPYAMITAAEDFAESLTLYYYGAYRGSWQVRTVYAQDVTGGVGKVEPLYVHDTQEILRSSEQQRSKMCQLAELVFADCKL